VTEIQSSVAQQAVTRNLVRNDILNCRQCDRRDIDECPVPFRGPAPARLMIVGDLPSELEEERGKAFTGGASSWLRLAMGRAGLDIDLCFLTNALACHSEDPLTPLQIRTCGRHMGRQVAVADPQLVLTMGKNAMDVVGVTKTTLTGFHGHCYVPPFGPFKGRNVVSTFAPAAGLRKGAENVQAIIEADLAVVANWLRGIPGPRANVGKGGKLIRSTH